MADIDKNVDTLENIDSIVEQSAVEWEQNRVKYTLDACLAEVTDRTRDIDILFDENKKLVALELVKKLVSNELVEACNDRMRVPEYEQKGRAKQMIYAYLGSHWELVPIQVFYDFCKAGAKKMGLTIDYAEDPHFMCDVFEQVFFRVSKHSKNIQPVGGVWINLKNCTVEIRPTPQTPSRCVGRGSRPTPQTPSRCVGRGSDVKTESSEDSNYSPSLTNGRGLGGGSVIATHDHRPEDFFLYSLPYSYDPDAECPLWHKFLDEVMPDKMMQTLLGEYIGYCFTRNLKLEKMAVFYGSGANGKSVIMDVLRKLFGRMNVSESTLSSVTTDPEARAQLMGKLVNISSESNKNIDSSILKMMVSGEAVEVRFLYIGTKIMENPPKLITSYNELPPMENTYGYRRRWLLFPFEHTIPEDKQDPALARKLCVELPGILNWVLGLLSRLIARVAKNEGEGFTTSQKCNSALEEYARSSNSVLMFLSECCKTDSTAAMKVKDVYNQYSRYCTAAGIKKPFTQKNFKKFAVEWGAEYTIKHNVQYFNIVVDNSTYE